MEGSVAVVHVSVVVHSLPVGQLRARLLGLQVLVQHPLIGRVGRQHSQQIVCGNGAEVMRVLMCFTLNYRLVCFIK